MNQCVLLGRLTRDSEMRTAISGTEVTKFTLAVDRNRKNDNGEKETDFINCIAFNKTAELIAKYTKKGSQIAVVGRIQTRSYDAQDGTKRYVTEVLISEVKFLDKKEDNLESMTDSQIIQKAMNEEYDPFMDIELTPEDLPW